MVLVESGWKLSSCRWPCSTWVGSPEGLLQRLLVVTLVHGYVPVRMMYLGENRSEGMQARVHWRCVVVLVLRPS